MFERRLKCKKCHEYSELMIQECHTRSQEGWTCRNCGYANRVTLAGQIACVTNDPVPVATTGPPVEPSSAGWTERRGHPRVMLTTPLFGRLTSGGQTFTVEEASARGFSMISPVMLAPGRSYQFRMWSDPAHATVVAAVCRSSTLIPDADGGSWRYRNGFQFLPQSGRRLRLILGAIAVNAP